MNKYLEQFMQFRCAGDVMNAVTPVNKMAKEITEAMGIWRRLRKTALKEPLKYSLIDACAGNGLVGVLSVFTLPVKRCIAFDKSPRMRKQWLRGTIERWKYYMANLYDDTQFESIVDELERDILLVAAHPCVGLAGALVERFNKYEQIRGLAILPCCAKSGTYNRFPRLLADGKLNKYELWCLHLHNQCEVEDKGVYHDPHIISPANCVVWARKG